MYISMLFPLYRPDALQSLLPPYSSLSLELFLNVCTNICEIAYTLFLMLFPSQYCTRSLLVSRKASQVAQVGMSLSPALLLKSLALKLSFSPKDARC